MNKPAPRFSLLGSLLLLTACVTVNIYFPAAAAEKAADRFIREVYGESLPKSETPADESVQPDQVPADTPDKMPQEILDDPQSGVDGSAVPWPLATLVNFLVTPVHAQQPDINISTPGINKLKNSMSARHEQLKPFYNSGAVGMDRNGFITIRDESAVPLKDRNTVKKLVSNENSDRASLYREIASANGHPEWEPDIKAIFAERWVANAPSGWWYQDGSGNWARK